MLHVTGQGPRNNMHHNVKRIFQFHIWVKNPQKVQSDTAEKMFYIVNKESIKNLVWDLYFEIFC